MASVGNATCARFDNVSRSGSVLYVKGTWLPSEFTISVCDGKDAWTGRATRDFVVNMASHLAMSESEYVDSVQYYFSQRRADARYEFNWGRDSTLELLCSKLLPHELILRLATVTDSAPSVAADMIQFLLDAHHRLGEEAARKARAYERELAAKDLALASLRNQETDHTNGVPDAAGAASSRGKRKAGASGAETGSRKRPLEPLPLLQRPPSPTPPEVLALRPPPLSELGYKQPPAGEARESSQKPSWLEKREPIDNGAADESNSDDQPIAPKKTFLDRLSDAAEVAPPGRKTSGKKRGKAKKKAQPRRSPEESLDQAEDVVEKGIKCVDNILHEASSPVKKALPTSTKKPAPSKSRKKGKPSAEAASEEDRAITVQNAEFHDFDTSRSEAAFEQGQFWALYDDQDGMPRFYGRVIGVQSDPFQVSVEWLEPLKPSLPAHGLVRSARLSAACGDFTFGTECTQALPAFSHIIHVGTDSKRPSVVLWPQPDQVWALYRHWDKKQAKREEGDLEYHYEYDLVKVQSQLSTTDGIAVVPLVKIEGFKSLFTVADGGLTYHIPYKQVQAIFSHCIPKHETLGSDSFGGPPGAWELDPASTPSEYLGTGAQEGMP